MIMITGGAFQGKTAYAKSRFSLSESDILDGRDCELSGIGSPKCITHYELTVKRMIEASIDPLKFSEELNVDIVIMNEIGCGIIPLEKGEREWREMAGRAGCIIAGRAVEVVRVCCGIASIIKGEMN